MTASRLLAVALFGVLLTACGPDLPDGVTSNEPAVFNYPDTVEVMVRAKVNPNDIDDFQLDEPTTYQKAWFEEHSYVRVGYEYDSTATADLIPDDQQKGKYLTAYYLLQYKRVE